jgi:hypothetical protein
MAPSSLQELGDGDQQNRDQQHADADHDALVAVFSSIVLSGLRA